MSEENKQPTTSEKKERAENQNYSSVRVNDTVGTTFLGVLAILMLVFLVRSNRRNRELLLEVISLRRQE